MSRESGLGFTRSLIENADSGELFRRVRDWIALATPTCLLHPLGFYVILLERDAQEEWRFHVWRKGARKFTGMPSVIHTHDKVVLSKVLSGEISNVMYATPEVTSGGYPVYEVEYVGDRYVSASTNVLVRTPSRVEPTITSTQLIQTGQSYSILAHDFHQTVVSELIAACTLVCMHSPDPTESIKLIGLDGYPHRMEFKRLQISYLKVLNHLSAL
jgi:hypothetical protein